MKEFEKFNAHPKYGDIAPKSNHGNGHKRSRCRNKKLKSLYGSQKDYLHTTVYFSDTRQCLKEVHALRSKIRKFAKNISNRKIRHNDNIPNYGSYKKFCRGLWWFI